MQIEQALYKRLSTYTDLTDLIGTKIYPALIPQGAVYPCMTYQRITTNFNHHLDGTNALEYTTIQFNIYHTTIANLCAVYDKVVSALQNYTATVTVNTESIMIHSCQIINVFDSYDTNTLIYTNTQSYIRQLELVVWYREV